MSIIPRMNKKGVSPIIATLLLIVIAVAAAVVTYAFVTGFIGTSSGSATQTGSMSFDTYTRDGSTMTVYLRNTGTKALTVQSVYLDGTPISITQAPEQFLPASIYILNCTNAPAVNNSAAHQLRVVCTDGTPLQISIVVS